MEQANILVVEEIMCKNFSTQSGLPASEKPRKLSANKQIYIIKTIKSQTKNALWTYQKLFRIAVLLKYQQ